MNIIQIAEKFIQHITNTWLKSTPTTTSTASPVFPTYTKLHLVLQQTISTLPNQELKQYLTENCDKYAQQLWQQYQQQHNTPSNINTLLLHLFSPSSSSSSSAYLQWYSAQLASIDFHKPIGAQHVAALTMTIPTHHYTPSLCLELLRALYSHLSSLSSPPHADVALIIEHLVQMFQCSVEHAQEEGTLSATSLQRTLTQYQHLLSQLLLSSHVIYPASRILYYLNIAQRSAGCASGSLIFLLHLLPLLHSSSSSHLPLVSCALSILDVAGKANSRQMTEADVLRWAMLFRMKEQLQSYPHLSTLSSHLHTLSHSLSLSLPIRLPSYVAGNSVQQLWRREQDKWSVEEKLVTQWLQQAEGTLPPPQSTISSSKPPSNQHQEEEEEKEEKEEEKTGQGGEGEEKPLFFVDRQGAADEQEEDEDEREAKRRADTLELPSAFDTLPADWQDEEEEEQNNTTNNRKKKMKKKGQAISKQQNGSSNDKNIENKKDVAIQRQSKRTTVSDITNEDTYEDNAPAKKRIARKR